MGLWYFLGSWLGKFYSGVEVESIEPPFYAAGSGTYSFRFVGRGFDNIPNDAIFVISNQNENPLVFIERIEDGFWGNLTNKTNFEMTLESNAPLTHSTSIYVGGIVSADRQTIYWVNDSRPLP